MAVTHIQAWAMGAFGSLVGGMVTAYYLGDKNVRESIIFIAPFMVIGLLGTFKVLAYIEPDMRLQEIQKTEGILF